MRWLGVLCSIVVLFGGCNETTLVIEDETVDLVIEHVYHYFAEEDTTPDVVIEHETTTVYVTEEDTTPDVVQEFYSDAADLPMLIWNVGGATPMAKKFRELNAGVGESTVALGDALALAKAGGASGFVDYQYVPLPTNWIGGLITSMDAGDTDNDVEIAVGSCRDAADAHNMRLAAVLTKKIDAAWVVGDDNGGMDTGAVAASELYAVWLIIDPTFGSEIVDALFSLSFTAPTMPAGYTHKRLIGAVKTDGTSDIIPFLQSGDEFVYLGNTGTVPPLDLNGAAITHNTWAQASLSVPPLCNALIVVQLLNLTSTSASGRCSIRSRPPTSWTDADPSSYYFEAGGITFDSLLGRGYVMTDAGSQIDYRAIESTGAATFYIWSIGFTMLTRREPQ